jgi:hypothetical protein
VRYDMGRKGVGQSVKRVGGWVSPGVLWELDFLTSRESVE